MQYGQERREIMISRGLIAMICFGAIVLPSSAFTGAAEIGKSIVNALSVRHGLLDDQNQQGGASTAAKDDIVLSSHDDSYDGDHHSETFSYKYKNIGSKSVDVAITVKAEHHGFYDSKSAPAPFRTDTFRFTLKPGDEHEVSGTWTIEKAAGEGDPEMLYGDDDHPELMQATYSDKSL
jgi:hypothetical protein